MRTHRRVRVQVVPSTGFPTARCVVLGPDPQWPVLRHPGCFIAVPSEKLACRCRYSRDVAISGVDPQPALGQFGACSGDVLGPRHQHRPKFGDESQGPQWFVDAALSWPCARPPGLNHKFNPLPGQEARATRLLGLPHRGSRPSPSKGAPEAHLCPTAAPEPFGLPWPAAFGDHGSTEA